MHGGFLSVFDCTRDRVRSLSMCEGLENELKNVYITIFLARPYIDDVFDRESLTYLCMCVIISPVQLQTVWR